MNVGVYIAEMFSTGNDATKRTVITEELDLRALGLRAEEDALWLALVSVGTSCATIGPWAIGEERGGAPTPIRNARRG